MIAAGGTGGHLFPAQALAEVLIARGWRVVLATDERAQTLSDAFPAEKRIALASATIRGRDPLAIGRALFTILRGVIQARAALTLVDPAIVIGFGGYPSLPALLGALSQGRRTVIHEQNAVSGRANRLVAPHVTAVACAFPTLLKARPRVQARAVVVGNPVRPEIRALAGLAYEPPTQEVRLLITGGSQGARVLSELAPAAIARLPEALRLRLRVQQQTRPESLDAARRVYADALVQAEVAPFFRDIAGRLAAAHLVIGRAGASTVSEVAVAGRPSILVPLKISLDDDQGQNAQVLAQAGAAEIAREDQLTADTLATALAALLANPRRLAKMAAAARRVATPDAAERLADLVEATAR
jgi:UDP-N-acetylglucosamine--N-acetylmuramyl-(pentapeptide) pyrophosphoryl-undecaprenol N-acetylglucosamine transferase